MIYLLIIIIKYITIMNKYIYSGIPVLKSILLWPFFQFLEVNKWKIRESYIQLLKALI